MENSPIVPQKSPASAGLSSENASGSLTLTQALATVQEIEQPNIFVAAQRGDIALLRELIESGQGKATDRDEQNITPLHWAAINAQLAACRYLLEQGAEVDALGGDLVATPMQWAARNGYLYVIQLLIAHNADPTITDSQGYNTLHLVTHSSSIMPLLYLLHQPIAVDTPDPQGHTSLMWAAYQGDAISVELLLRHGASPTTKDAGGLTPLHWAVVRGNKICIRKLIEAGADINAKDEAGKTPKDMAVELKSLGAWKRAFEEGGMTEDGRKKSKPLSERNTRIAILILPTLFFYLIFKTLAILPWYTGLLLALAEFFGMHHIVTRVLLNHQNYTDNITHSPYFTGIILASMVWVAFAWATRLVTVSGYAFTHMIFILVVLLCAYNFFRSITLDPGTCPKPANDAELKTIIEDLASEGRLNGQTFCISCMAKKPLRSKHCRVCDRCVGRFDHHCPWVWNCVGVNNHRQFVVFVVTLVIGICLFDYLAYAYFSYARQVPSDDNPIDACSVLPDYICAATRHDPFIFSISAWATLQLSWTIVLLAGQLWQIARQMTTLEVSNLGRFGFMGGRGGASLGTQQGHAHHGHHHAEDDTTGDSTGLGGTGAHSHGKHGACGSGFLLQILGLDRYTKGKAREGLVRATTATNPFDSGFVGNCKDFWTIGRELGVEYESLYDVPPEGFAEAKVRRQRMEEEEDPAGNGRRRPKTLLGMWRGSGSREAAYSPLRMEETV